MSNKIGAKEELLCQSLVRFGGMSEAKRTTGYCESEILALLDKPKILEHCKKIASQNKAGDTLALQGLTRLAFGSVNDGIKLAVKGDEMSIKQIARLDLFGLSDISQSKSGRYQVKFYDRLKALELLLGYQHDQGQSGVEDFISALGNTVDIKSRLRA